MKNSTRNQAKGAFHKLAGALKEAAGRLSDNPKLKSKGTAEKIAGAVQEKAGQIEKVLGK
jgi:uncharacterized protein YjbJ (UPF0337 family)